MLERRRRIEPALADIEAAIAPVSDPRLRVHLRIPGCAPRRIHPGTFDDPMAALDQILRTEPLDGIAADCFGFGYAELLDITTIGMDIQGSMFDTPADHEAGHFPVGAVERAAALLSGGELLAHPDAGWVARCRNPHRVQALLAGSDEVARRARRHLFLTVANRPCIAPAGLLLRRLLDAAGELALHLAKDHRFAEAEEALARQQLAELLLSGSHPVEPEDGADGGLIAYYGEHHAVVFRTPNGKRGGDSDGHPHHPTVVVTAFGHTPYRKTTPPTIAISELRRLLRRADLADIAPFLDELNASEKLPIAHSVVDLFELGASSQPGTHIPRVADATWADDAAWEPLDAVLFAIGAEPSRCWRTRRLESDGEGSVSGQVPPVHLMLRVVPPLVVHLDCTSTTDLTLLFNLGDGLRLRAADDPLRWLLRRVAPSSATVLDLRLVDAIADPEDDIVTHRDPEDPIIEFGLAANPAAEEGSALWGLTVDRHLIHAHAIDPDGAHAAIGEALLHLASICTNVSDSERQQFRDEWAQRDPIIVAALHSTIGQDLPMSPPLLQRNHRRAAEVATNALLASCTDPAAPRADPLEVTTRVLCPALLAEIDDQLAGLDTHVLLRITCEQLEQSMAWRRRHEAHLLLARHAPWEPEPTDDPGPDMSRHVRALELLIERLCIAGVHEGSPTDHRHWIDLVSIADALIGAATTADYARCGLGPVISYRGTAPQQGDDTATAFDLAAYHQAHQDHLRRNEGWAPEASTRDALAAGTGPNEFISIDSIDIPEGWLALDEMLRVHVGAGFDAITAVLGTAATWAVTSEAPAGLIEITELLHAAAEWSQIDPASIEVAISLLTLSGERLASGPLDYWRLESRPQRMATRPLVPDGLGRLWILPHRVQATQNLLVAHFDDGRLPWPDLPPPVLEVTRQLRKKMDGDLEAAVAKICTDTGLTVRANVLPRKARKLGIDWTDKAGEADVLAAHPAQMDLWVLEAKHRSTAVSSWQIRQGLRQFHEPDGYLDRHFRRVRTVEAAPDVIALSLLGMTRGPWTVRHAIVTRTPQAAAFTADPRATFVCLDDLPSLLTSSYAPAGHWTPFTPT